MREVVKKHGLTALFIVLLVLFVYYRTWWGVGGLLLFITILQIARLVVFFKSIPWIKDIMLDSIKKWERVQLGYDLDDPYWDNHKRPTLMQKLFGINPNHSKEENRARKETNKEIVKTLSFKEKYFHMFDYKTGSKGIYLLVSITLAIILLRNGVNILLVFGIIFILGSVKKLIDKKYSN